MKKIQSIGLLVLGSAALLVSTGCFSTVRTVRKIQPLAPEKVQTASVEQLEKEIQERDQAIHTLNATVELTATTGGGLEGKEKTYTTVRGFIVVRKPRDLRVILQLPLVGSKAADMEGDADGFKLLMPPLSRAYVGSNEVTQPSANSLENLRPAVFLDSLLVPGIDPEDFVTVTSATRLLEPTRRGGHLLEEPVYDLTYLHVMSGKLLAPERVIRISRESLLPVAQDVYNNKGQIVTHATYSDYQPAAEAGKPFPRTIVISRPLDELNLTITVTKLTINEKVEDDQFELKIPATYKVIQMR